MNDRPMNFAIEMLEWHLARQYDFYYADRDLKPILQRIEDLKRALAMLTE